MQKFVFVMLLGCGTLCTASAQKTPPTAVISAFNQKFTQVTGLKWGKEKNGEWEAEFDQKGMEMSANFTADGKWVETETEIQFTDLPTPVQAALKGKKVKEAAKILKADGTTVYEAEVRHKDLVFDANGNLLADFKE
jgi:uncharacterized membrane protein YkoI